MGALEGSELSIQSFNLSFLRKVENMSNQLNQAGTGPQVPIKAGNVERKRKVLPLCFGPRRSSGRTPPAEPWLRNEQAPQSRGPQVSLPAPPETQKSPQQL